MEQSPDAASPASPQPMGPWILQSASLEGCPLHRTGDRLLVRPPALHHAGSGCCLVPFLKLRTLLREGREGDIRCSWLDCSGMWTARREVEASEATLDPSSLESDLENRPFLLQLPQAVALTLLNSGERVDFDTGEYILRHNQANNELYLVVRGSLEVLDGELRISTIPRGECVGEMSILTRQPVSNSVRAATPCTLVSVPRDRFHELLSQYPSLGNLLNRLLARRLRASNQQLESILRPGIWGNLEVFPFLSVVQSIQAGSMTGLLDVTRGRARASFGFDKGQLRHAQLGDRNGEDAILEILQWNNGIFRFQEEPFQAERNIHGDTMAVLLEALRKFDEIQLQESAGGGASSTRLEALDTSLSDTRWDPQAVRSDDSADATTQIDPDADGTSEFDIGALGLKAVPGN